jgi:hypothetical protein
MFFLLGKDTWTHILPHQGPWEPKDAYKVLWLILVAYPLWSAGKLAGSSAEGITSGFLWVILPIVAVPWGYVFVNYIYRPNKRNG